MWRLSLTTLKSAYNEKKYAEIFLHYRWLFIKGDVFIGEWEILFVEVFLHYSQFFIKGDFIVDGVELWSYIHLLTRKGSDKCHIHNTQHTHG